MTRKVVLITGAARRIGAVIARILHAEDMNIIIHYRSSKKDAEKLCDELNQNRPNSAAMIAADLQQTAQLSKLIDAAHAIWQRLDVLINNASSFYPTPMGNVNETQWEDLMASNLKAPFFLSQYAAALIAKQQGSIINIADINAKKPLKNYSVYCVAKAGLIMLTKSLAKELAPQIRVNAIAPGSILWAEGKNQLSEEEKLKAIDRILLKRQGKPEEIAKAILFLIRDDGYITGQTLAVDGGRSLY